jgi:glycosyltransferase involved in cell wall biosynthesis
MVVCVYCFFVDVSVVVPALNEERAIGVCLKSVRAQDASLDFEVVVCDGRSVDRTAAVAGRYADRVVFSDVRSVGFQRNLGARNSSGRLLLFVDADTVLPPDYLRKAVEKFEKNRRLAALSASFRFSERGRRLAVAERATNAYLVFRDKVGAATLPGFNTFVRRRAFDSVGGFQDIPLEDIDFSRRIKSAGETHYYTDFHVITSARRLDRMGLLGTLRYYIEMDLTRVNPELRKLLTYSDYVSCRVDSRALEEAFSRLAHPAAPISAWSSSMRDYAKNRLTPFTDVMRQELKETKKWAKTARDILLEKTEIVSDALSYVESKTIDSEIVDKALKQVEDRFRRRKNTF